MGPPFVIPLNISHFLVARESASCRPRHQSLRGGGEPSFLAGLLESRPGLLSLAFSGDLCCPCVRVRVSERVCASVRVTECMLCECERTGARACVRACVCMGINAAEKRHVRRTCCGALDSWNSPGQANDHAAGWGFPASGSANHAAPGFRDHGRGHESRLGAEANASLATCAEGNASRPAPPEGRRHAHAPSPSSDSTTCLQRPRRELSKARLAAKPGAPALGIPGKCPPQQQRHAQRHRQQ